MAEFAARPSIATHHDDLRTADDRWVAMRDNWEPDSRQPTGSGATEEDAVKDLLTVEAENELELLGVGPRLPDTGKQQRQWFADGYNECLAALVDAQVEQRLEEWRALRARQAQGGGE